MAFESGGAVFFQLPVRHAALRTHTDELLVPQPSGRPAVPRVVYDEFLVTVGGDPGPVSKEMYGLLTDIQYGRTEAPEGWLKRVERA